MGCSNKNLVQMRVDSGRHTHSSGFRMRTSEAGALASLPISHNLSRRVRNCIVKIFDLQKIGLHLHISYFNPSNSGVV